MNVTPRRPHVPVTLTFLLRMQSIEPHLRDALEPLQTLLPEGESEELSKHLSGNEIPYDLLQRISRWSQANPETLKAQSIQPAAYSMLSMLAGSTTSPSSRFPTPKAESELPPDLSTAKAVTTLINAILCVFASGFATLWAAKHSGWRYEWVGHNPFEYLHGLTLLHSASALCLSGRDSCRDLGGCFVYDMGVSKGGTQAHEREESDEWTSQEG